MRHLSPCPVAVASGGRSDSKEDAIQNHGQPQRTLIGHQGKEEGKDESGAAGESAGDAGGDSSDQERHIRARKETEEEEAQAEGVEDCVTWYLCKWRGFDDKDSTWETVDEFSSRDLLAVKGYETAASAGPATLRSYLCGGSCGTGAELGPCAYPLCAKGRRASSKYCGDTCGILMSRVKVMLRCRVLEARAAEAEAAVAAKAAHAKLGGEVVKAEEDLMQPLLQ
jgi:hypothetical protein